jgi:hypothetical protein
MEQNEAINIFMERVGIRAYKSVLDEINSLLTAGPVGHKPKAEDVQLHEWHEGLDATSKLMVERMVKHTAYNVLFGFLVLLDNQTMGYPIEGVLSDFALYIQSYPDKASRANNQPKDAIRVNSPKNNIDLHDLIAKYIE